MTSKFPITAALLFATLAVAGCSATTQQPDAVALAPGQASPAAYALSEEEKSLDCKKLTGRMQVRILQARDYDAGNRPSAVSHSLQSVAVLAGSGATQGLDPSSDHARDRAQLEAYNQKLASMNCKTFNLDDELKPKPVTATPNPVAKPKDGAAPADPRTTVTVPISAIGQKPAGASKP